MKVQFQPRWKQLVWGTLMMAFLGLVLFAFLMLFPDAKPAPALPTDLPVRLV